MPSLRSKGSEIRVDTMGLFLAGLRIKVGKALVVMVMGSVSDTVAARCVVAAAAK